MIREDARGRRVVIVADFLVNPDAPFYAGIDGHPGPILDLLAADGWGLMKLPPHVLGENVGRPAAVTIAGDAADYLKHGYAVVLLAVEGVDRGGVWLDFFESAFRDLGKPMPPVVWARLAGDRRANAADVRDALALVTSRAATGAAAEG